jgi:hypothetical protein
MLAVHPSGVLRNSRYGHEQSLSCPYLFSGSFWQTGSQPKDSQYFPEKSMVSKIIFRLSLIIGIAALAYAGVNAVKQPAASTASNIETYEEVEIPLDAFREGRGVRSLDAFDTTIKSKTLNLVPFGLVTISQLQVIPIGIATMCPSVMRMRLHFGAAIQAWLTTWLPPVAMKTTRNSI